MRLVAVVVTLAVLAGVAQAQDARARAAALFEQGRVHYEANEFRLAIEKFTQAYGLVNDPVYLFNIAQSYRNAADCELAFDYYEKYLDENSNAPNAGQVRLWIAELRPCAERIKSLTAKASSQPEPVSRPAPAPAPQPITRPHSEVIDRGSSLRTLGLLTATGGAMVLVVGIVYGVKAQGYENEIGTACTRECLWDDLDARDKAGERANTIAWVGYIAGGVGLGAGIGLYIAGMSKVERVTVTPTGDGATVSARIRF